MVNDVKAEVQLCPMERSCRLIIIIMAVNKNELFRKLAPIYSIFVCRAPLCESRASSIVNITSGLSLFFWVGRGRFLSPSVIRWTGHAPIPLHSI